MWAACTSLGSLDRYVRFGIMTHFILTLIFLLSSIEEMILILSLSPPPRFQIFRFMQFAGKTPPVSIVVLFVAFFPLQGFFNLVGKFSYILLYYLNGLCISSNWEKTFTTL